MTTLDYHDLFAIVACLCPVSMITTTRDGRTLTLCNRVRQQPCSSLDDAGVVVRSQFEICSACVGKVKYRVVYIINGSIDHVKIAIQTKAVHNIF